MLQIISLQMNLYFLFFFSQLESKKKHYWVKVVNIGLNKWILDCCCLVAKLCLTLSQPYGLSSSRLLCPWNSPGKTTGVVAISFFRRSSWLRDWTCVSCIGRWILHHWATWEAHPQTSKDASNLLVLVCCWPEARWCAPKNQESQRCCWWSWRSLRITRIRFLNLKQDRTTIPSINSTSLKLLKLWFLTL